MSPSWLKQGDEKSKQCAVCQRVLYNKVLPSRRKDFTWVAVFHSGEGHLSNSTLSILPVSPKREEEKVRNISEGHSPRT